MKNWIFACAIAAAIAGNCATVVDVTGVGAHKKKTVSIGVTGAGADAYTKTLKRNLELTGCFQVENGGAIKVSGAIGGTITASGAGKSIGVPTPAGDDKAVRMSARRMSDEICAAMSEDGQKGFACDRVVFVSRKSPQSSELCMCYPDGQDVRQLTSDGKAAVGPRWKDAKTVYYIGYLNGGQQIFEHNVETGERKVAFNLKGISSPAAISPDGTKVAIAASFQGNPELYVLSGGRYTRLTNTKTASEGQPTWSPDVEPRRNGNRVCLRRDAPPADLHRQRRDEGEAPHYLEGLAERRSRLERERTPRVHNEAWRACSGRRDEPQGGRLHREARDVARQLGAPRLVA